MKFITIAALLTFPSISSAIIVPGDDDELVCTSFSRTACPEECEFRQGKCRFRLCSDIIDKWNCKRNAFNNFRCDWDKKQNLCTEKVCKRLRDMDVCNARDDCIQVSSARCADKEDDACEDITGRQACNNKPHCTFDNNLGACSYSSCEEWDFSVCRATFGLARCDWTRRFGCTTKRCTKIKVQEICEEREDCVVDESNGKCITLPIVDCKEISDQQSCNDKSHCFFDTDLNSCIFNACEEWSFDECKSSIGLSRCDWKKRSGCTAKKCKKIKLQEICEEREDCAVDEYNGKCVDLSTADPTTADPTTTDPTTADPTTADPTTADPTTADPTTADPTTADPTTADPTTADPTTADPTTADPTTADPTTADPTTADPTTADPTTADPTTADPTTADPTTADPTTADPTTADPTTADPTTSDPTTADPATADPTTSDPTIASNFKLAVQMIDLDSSGLTESEKTQVIQAFESSTEKWRSVIVETTGMTSLDPASTPSRQCYDMFTFAQLEEMVEDLLIGAVIAPIDGSGRVLGSAGPCVIGYASNGRLFPRVGGMKFDSADVSNMIRNGIFEGVVLHEMGHVLGIGTIWDRPDFGNDFVRQDANNNYLWYEDGVNAIQANTRVQQSSTPIFPIIESDGGSGTAGAHWDEVEYEDELMTGWVNQDMALSELTVGALEDLGYGVNYLGADEYIAPDARVGRNSPQKSKRLREVRPVGEMIVLDKKNREMAKNKL